MTQKSRSSNRSLSSEGNQNNSLLKNITEENNSYENSWNNSPKLGKKVIINRIAIQIRGQYHNLMRLKQTILNIIKNYSSVNWHLYDLLMSLLVSDLQK